MYYGRKDKLNYGEGIKYIRTSINLKIEIIMESKFKGKVKFYNDKGYGFITDVETEKDIFFHHTGLLDKVQADDLVEYETEEGERGLKAVSVKLVKLVKVEEEKKEKIK